MNWSVLSTAPLWLPGYSRTRLQTWRSAPPKRIWVTLADHYEPWWRHADDATALERVRRWTRLWPEVAHRNVDSAGRPACYTFFYPEEQYHPAALDALARFQEAGIGDVEIHLHHDADTQQGFLDRMGVFLERLHLRHGLLRKNGAKVAFGFIHGNWALDNSLPGGKFCGLNNEITLLRDLGCYADFTLPSAPSPAQAGLVNQLYWAKDDPLRPRSHETGIPVTVGGHPAGDLMMIPGPLTVNLREFRQPRVPRLETGELAGNCRPTRHRARLWMRAAPRLGQDQFIKLFAHGAPEKNAVPLLEEGWLSRTLEYLKTESQAVGAQIFFVSAWQMWRAIEALRLGADPLAAIAPQPQPGARCAGNLL